VTKSRIGTGNWHLRQNDDVKLIWRRQQK